MRVGQRAASIPRSGSEPVHAASHGNNVEDGGAGHSLLAGKGVQNHCEGAMQTTRVLQLVTATYPNTIWQ